MMAWDLAGGVPFATREERAKTFRQLLQTVCDHGAKTMVTAPKLPPHNRPYENHTLAATSPRNLQGIKMTSIQFQRIFAKGNCPRN